jgi:hypothetical protein
VLALLGLVGLRKRRMDGDPSLRSEGEQGDV